MDPPRVYRVPSVRRLYASIGVVFGALSASGAFDSGSAAHPHPPNAIAKTVALSIGVLIAWFGIVRLGGSRVAADDDGLLIRNPYRSLPLEWSKVKSVGIGRGRLGDKGLVVATTDGRRIFCVGLQNVWSRRRGGAAPELVAAANELSARLEQSRSGRPIEPSAVSLDTRVPIGPRARWLTRHIYQLAFLVFVAASAIALAIGASAGAAMSTGVAVVGGVLVTPMLVMIAWRAFHSRP